MTTREPDLYCIVLLFFLILLNGVFDMDGNRVDRVLASRIRPASPPDTPPPSG